MFCSKCGNELNEEAIFCPKCGNKVNVVHSEENIKENTFANTVDNELNDTSVENTENVSVTNDKEESIVEENFCSERKPEFVNPKSNTDSFEKVTLDESEKKSEGDDTESFKDLFRGLLDSLENEDYLFFKDLKHRAKIQLISLVLSKVLLGLGAIAGIVYIIQETRAGEGYKLGFYIIGFLIAIMPYMIPSGLFDCVTEILDFQKDSIKKEYDPKLYLGLGNLALPRPTYIHDVTMVRGCITAQQR